MKNRYGLAALATSLVIAMTGCASKPFEAAKYAMENKRLTSETHLASVEPDEEFSSAMEIMYDITQVDVDYKNNLDKPYISGSTVTKDILSAGGTFAMLANGASLLDAGSFFFGYELQEGNRPRVQFEYYCSLCRSS